MREATFTVKELEFARAQAAEMVAKLGNRFSSGISINENIAELYVLDEKQLTTDIQNMNAELPPEVRIVRVDELP